MINTSTHLHLVRLDDNSSHQDNLSREEQDMLDFIQPALDKNLCEPDPLIIAKLLEHSAKFKD